MMFGKSIMSKKVIGLLVTSKVKLNLNLGHKEYIYIYI